MKYGEYQNEREFDALLDIFTKLNPKSVLEIGSLLGGTLYQFIQRMEKESKITSIDMLVSEQDSRYINQKLGHDTLWKEYAKKYGVILQIIEESSRNLSSFTKVVNFTPVLDFLFIDGDHSYIGAKSDYDMYSKIVRSDGIIALHDISPIEGTSQVSKLWEEIKQTNYTDEFLFDSTGKGIGIVYV